MLLACDIYRTPRGSVHTVAQADAVMMNEPVDRLGKVARLVAVNMTPLAWFGYIVLLDGLLASHRSNSPARVRPHHFAALCLASIFIWCLFDVLNFHGGMRAWVYIGLPTEWSDKAIGYTLAFASIVPGMLMSGQVMLNLGWFDFARGPSWRLPAWGSVAALLVGVAMCAWPLCSPSTLTNLTLWTSLAFLLDPINDWLGRPSVLRDFQAGWYGRTLAAGAGGLLCGFLWEFWNYWALTKWTYHLPFLGSWNRWHYFEMPLPGLVGFIAFGIECWVMWQTIRIPLDGLVEPLPNGRSLL